MHFANCFLFELYLNRCQNINVRVTPHFHLSTIFSRESDSRLSVVRPSVRLSVHRRCVRRSTGGGSVTLKKMNDGGLVTLFLLSCTSFLLLLHFFT